MFWIIAKTRIMVNREIIIGMYNIDEVQNSKFKVQNYNLIT